MAILNSYIGQGIPQPRNIKAHKAPKIDPEVKRATPLLINFIKVGGKQIY